MKKLLLILIGYIGKLIPYNFFVILKSYRNLIYTQWLKNYLGNIGESSIIEKPCQIMGGGQSRINIGENTYIHAHSILGCWKKHKGFDYTPSIIIGNSCSIGEYNHITSCNNIVIGNGVLTGRFVLISDNNHGGSTKSELGIPPSNRRLTSKGAIIIGDNVWIGDKVTVLGGVHIGKNVTVAANAVVASDIPDNCIVAGIPARIIKTL